MFRDLLSGLAKRHEVQNESSVSASLLMLHAALLFAMRCSLRLRQVGTGPQVGIGRGLGFFARIQPGSLKDRDCYVRKIAAPNHRNIGPTSSGSNQETLYAEAVSRYELLFKLNNAIIYVFKKMGAGVLMVLNLFGGCFPVCVPDQSIGKGPRCTIDDELAKASNKLPQEGSIKGRSNFGWSSQYAFQRRSCMCCFPNNPKKEHPMLRSSSPVPASLQVWKVQPKPMELRIPETCFASQKMDFSQERGLHHCGAKQANCDCVSFSV